jgi:hypothetical protein
VKASPVFKVKGTTEKKEINKEISELEQISAKLDQEEVSMEKRRTDARKNGSKAGVSVTGLTRESYNILEKNLEKEIQILEKSSKETIKIYNYANEEELLKGQTFLIRLADHTLTYINEADEKLTSLKWRVLITLLKRGEFSLS